MDRISRRKRRRKEDRRGRLSALLACQKKIERGDNLDQLSQRKRHVRVRVREQKGGKRNVQNCRFYGERQRKEESRGTDLEVVVGDIGRLAE